MELNSLWEQRILDSGTDFVRFVDISPLPVESTQGFPCAVLFGKALSKEYVRTLRAGQEPLRKEMNNTERKMDALAVKLADRLNAEGYPSVAKLPSGSLPHKTVALRTGEGFIGKNNLLVTTRFGCALLLGKVLTTAPFVAAHAEPPQPLCGDCSICVDVCPTRALLGTTWSVTTTREEILARKRCALCLMCMVWCPYTMEYMNR
ncbi:MAG: epoxyqueuosine reductase [Clostridia bacterium]|nr:epoxyqueuosine reductase [Clostridia bacterium]